MASVGFMPNGVDLKAERRKPSGEQHCDIEDIPSLTGVLAHFRLHEFKAIRGKLDGRLIQSKGHLCGMGLETEFAKPFLAIARR